MCSEEQKAYVVSLVRALVCPTRDEVISSGALAARAFVVVLLVLQWFI